MRERLRIVACLALACLALVCYPDAAHAGDVPRAGGRLTWSAITELPPAPGQTRQIGLAGPFAGVSDGPERGGGVLIVAGGANFPDRPPWEGGGKVWWDDVFVLQRSDQGTYMWLAGPTLKLPRPLAYGVSVSADDGVVCIGGCDAERCYADVFLLRWSSGGGGITTEALPPLPRPLAFSAGAMVGDTVYVCGGKEAMRGAGATKDFFALDLSKRRSETGFGWKELPPWPGPARILPVVAAQSDGSDDCLYVFSGRNEQPGADTVPLTDAYSFNPGKGEWKKLADVAPKGEAARPVMAGTGIDYGEYHVLVFGGSDGKLFLKLARLEGDIAKAKAAGDDASARSLVSEKLGILTDHPGFSRRVLAYHTLTDTWVDFGELPATSHVTTAAVRWQGSVVIPTGEVSPGIRSPKVWKADTAEREASFGAANWAVLVVYLASLVAMGVYFSRREKTTGDFFLAGKRVPWWAAGLSIYGTQLSAITFMAIPATTYRLDWLTYLAQWMIIAVAPVVAFLYIPVFCRLKVTTAYEFLEKRFNLAVRLYASAAFILFQLGRMAVVVLLPALALSAVTGIDKYTCIVIMGVLCTLYTVLGGIEAVIWTDVLQVAVLLGGAALSFFVIAAGVDGGFGGIIDAGRAHGKFRMADWSWDYTRMAIWVVVIGNFLNNVFPYTADQTVVQRYLTTKDEREARKSLWTAALMVIPGSLIFFGIGSALFAFYRTNPGLLDPMLSNDAIFPHFINQNLPAGVAGLVIAGVFAAAMSSLDSSMNSIATAFTTDFYRRFKPNTEDRKCLNLARIVTVVLGAVGTVSAIVLASYGGRIKSLWFFFGKIIGLVGGGIAGVFILAIFTRRATGRGALVGAITGAAVQIYVAFCTDVHFFLYAAVGIVTSCAVGYAASLVIPGEQGSVDGTTMYSLKRGGQ